MFPVRATAVYTAVPTGRRRLALRLGVLAVLWLSGTWLAARPVLAALPPARPPGAAVPVFPVTFEQAAAAYEAGDYLRAAMLWRRLAEQGDADAQYNLGILHYHGQGVSHNPAAAVDWYRQAARQGHPAAQYNLGVAYARGIGLEQDWRAAMRWWQQAAAQGHAQAQYNLGFLYATGLGVERDPARAAAWWQQAAQQGDAAAQYNLGVLYATGQGVARDLTEAVHWWQRSAEQGFEDARRALDLVEAQEGAPLVQGSSSTQRPSR